MRHELYVGQIVSISISGKDTLARIDKINPRKIRITVESGAVYSASPSLLKAVSSEEADSFAASKTTDFVVGAGVRFKATSTSWTKVCPYPVLVVVGQHSGNYRLAPLGGDRGKYFRGVPAEAIERVNLALNEI